MEISKLDKLIKPSGTMAISNKARELKSQGKPVIGFGAGEPDFPSPDYVVDAAKKAIEDPKNHKYSPVAGLASLRNEIARTTLEYSGFEVDPNNILVSNGGKQAIITCLMAILNSKDEVIIPSPYWTTYPEAVKIAGGNPVFIQSTKEQDFKVDVSMLEEAKTDKTKLLIWCSPSNPTGVVYTLIDKNLNNSLIINGVSKAYSMTGWRVGWLIANNEVIGLAKKIQSQATSNVSNVSQLAAESALKNGLDVTKEMKISFERRRNFAIKKIESIHNLSVVNGVGAFYLYVDVNFYCTGKFLDINSSEDFCNWLIENYFIAFVPGEVFGTNGFMRLSYALSDQELEEGLERLATAIDYLNG